jgi:hypothetical protein
MRLAEARLQSRQALGGVRSAALAHGRPRYRGGRRTRRARDVEQKFGWTLLRGCD